MTMANGKQRFIQISIVLVSTLLALTTVSKAQYEDKDAYRAPHGRQLDYDDDESTTTIAPVTVSPAKVYENLLAGLNFTTGVFQDLICGVPFLRLCEGANGIKLMKYPIPPTTLPTTPLPTTIKAPVAVGVAIPAAVPGVIPQVNVNG